MKRLTLLILPFAFLVASCGGSTPEPVGFAHTISALSGPGGYFDTDNLISNERSYLHAVSDLRAAGVRGGAYLGVGPGQNFSYIAEIDPELAIIIDLRRDNVLQHLIYKALFETSPTRAEYLTALTGRAPPDDPDRLYDATVEDIVDFVDGLEPDDASAAAARATVLDRVESFGFALSAGDIQTIERFHGEFIQYGLDLRFRSHGRAPQYYYPTLRELVLEVDREGEPASYLSSRERYGRVRRLQLADGVLPIVGDLAGDVALGAVAAHLESEGLHVSAFYTSNVEFYLFGSRTFGRFVDNLRRLPLTDESVIIKSHFPGGFGGSHPLQEPGYYSTQIVQSASGLVAGWDAGRYRDYWSIVTEDLVGLVPVP
ncbi:MAG: hypothetical protein ACC682_13750 [Gemmatimonadota bacterium]